MSNKINHIKEINQKQRLQTKGQTGKKSDLLSALKPQNTELLRRKNGTPLLIGLVHRWPRCRHSHNPTPKATPPLMESQPAKPNWRIAATRAVFGDRTTKRTGRKKSWEGDGVDDESSCGNCKWCDFEDPRAHQWLIYLWNSRSFYWPFNSLQYSLSPAPVEDGTPRCYKLGSFSIVAMNNL